MKRKPKLTTSNFCQQAIIEMTWQGFSRGIAFGGLYGVLMFLAMVRNTDHNLLPGFLLAAMCLPFPLGASFGMIAGTILGFLNGVTIGLLTRLFFVPTINWKLYRSSVAVLSALCTLAGGMFIFSVVFSRSDTLYFRDFVYIVAPALIAAIVFAYASQSTARRYMASQ
jgi:hypothetical protein